MGLNADDGEALSPAYLTLEQGERAVFLVEKGIELGTFSAAGLKCPHCIRIRLLVVSAAKYLADMIARHTRRREFLECTVTLSFAPV